MAPRMDAISNVDYNHNDENHLVSEAGCIILQVAASWFKN